MKTKNHYFLIQDGLDMRVEYGPILYNKHKGKHFKTLSELRNYAYYLISISKDRLTESRRKIYFYKKEK